MEQKSAKEASEPLKHNSEIKPAKIRSVAYPSYTLAYCAEKTKSIYQIFGNTIYANRPSISKQLDISDSHLQTQLSSATQYGLLDMKQKEGYKPTELFTKIYKPLNDEEKREALLECFCTPPLYLKLIEHFNGKDLPTEGGLATILFRSYKIAEAASLSAANVFIENANDLGLIKGTLFSIDNRKEKEEETAIDEEESIESTETNEPNKQNLLPSSSKKDPKTEQAKVIDELLDLPPIPILLSGGRVAKLFMPADYKDEDFSKGCQSYKWVYNVNKKTDGRTSVLTKNFVSY